MENQQNIVLEAFHRIKSVSRFSHPYWELVVLCQIPKGRMERNRNFSSPNTTNSTTVIMDLQHQLLLSGFGLIAVLHTVGLILLYKTKDDDLPNQRLVTMDLAATEMIFCLWSISRYLWYFFAYKEYHEQQYLIVFIDTVLYTMIKFAILHIIIDRFLYIYLNLKYPVYITKKVLAISKLMQWLVGIILNMAFTLYKVNLVSWGYTYLFFDIIIIITTVTSFIYISTKVRRINSDVNSRKRRGGLLHVWLKLKIPTLMVLSYIFFNGTSSAMKLFYATHANTLYLVIPATIFDLCGYLSDAFIYILLQRRVRILLIPRQSTGTSL